MDIRAICIGDELLSGDTLNTNLLYIGGRLSECGYRMSGEQCVPDDEASLRSALQAAHGADVVLIIGGLGPTKDDLTRPVTAAFLGRRLQMHQEIVERIERYLGERGRKMPHESMEVQAMVPENAIVLQNNNGTAPGLLMREADTLWFMMPGPPREMHPIFENDVLPRIKAAGNPEWEERALRVVGLGESIVEREVETALGGDIAKYHVAYCIKDDCVMVKLTVPFGSATLDDAYQRLAAQFGRRMIPADCISAVEYLGRILKERGLVVATAESCTGGGIAAAMTDIPGSSEWFHGAFVTYTNEWKHRMLGVRGDVLEAFGAVSHQTVMDMLDGVLRQKGVDLAIAVSGIAGPGGGTDEKPVGTVYVGVGGDGWRFVRRMHFNGLRDTVRLRTKNAAINMLFQKLER